MFVNTLSGRFLMLTIVFVMLAEVVIFLPSVARFREDFLASRLERAQIASLALLASTDDMVEEALEQELLSNADVLNVVLYRNEVRELVLSSPMTGEISKTVDLRTDGAFRQIADSVARLSIPRAEWIRVVDEPVKAGGMLIEITMNTAKLRSEMLDYSFRILALSAFISVLAAMLLFLAVRRFIVKPITRVVDHMKAYEAAPEDARQIITPSAGVVELHEAEEALQSMQTRLSASLRQRQRLADLGGAVSKISHDLRNILTTATLLADRMEMSEDPAVKRTAPKLVGSLSRAVNLCERTLSFGKAEEPAPEISSISLKELVDDVLESERLASDADLVILKSDIGVGVVIQADNEQIFRVFSNLVRNARQAIEATKKPGSISVTFAQVDRQSTITFSDTGPGLPARAREKLFQPFEGGVRQGGTGLGLAIAAELVKGHGGELILGDTSKSGTEFIVRLPLGEMDEIGPSR
jgi:signal transduction histidine kinase